MKKKRKKRRYFVKNGFEVGNGTPFGQKVRSFSKMGPKSKDFHE